MLEFNGESIAQSMTIARFLAKEFNLAGKNNWEQAKADMVAECVQDLVNSKRTVFLIQSTHWSFKLLSFKNYHHF